MNIRILTNAEQVAINCAMLIASQVINKPNSVLGLSTGSSPIRSYEYLIKWHQEGLVDFSSATSFNLDEYLGLEPTHDQSYHYFMQEKLFSKINLKQSFIPNGNTENTDEECINYENKITSMGGIDLQLLGLGINAHIGFNEPDSTFSKSTRVADLAPSTIEANKRFFESADDVPKKAITMGIGTIMRSKKILLIAYGKSKAEAIRNMVKGDINPMVPSSILNLHKDVTILIDKEAASLL